MTKKIFSTISAITLIFGLSNLSFAQSSDTILIKVVVRDTTAPLPPLGFYGEYSYSYRYYPKVGFDWAKNTEADLQGYNIYRSQIHGGPYEKLNSQPFKGAGYDDTNLTIGITYYYVITAVDNSGNESDYSKEISVIAEGPQEINGVINFPRPNEVISGNIVIQGSANGYESDAFGTLVLYYDELNVKDSNTFNHIIAEFSESDFSQTWNTSSAANGSHTLNLGFWSSTDIGDSLLVLYSVPVTVKNNFSITNLAVYPNIISPFGYEYYQQSAISALLNEEGAAWTVAIKEYYSGSQIKQFTGSGPQINAIWGAKDESGNIVADGFYTYEVSASYNNQTLGPVSGTINVDTVISNAVINSPTTNQTISGNTDIIGTVMDSKLSYWNLYYGSGANPAQWYTIMYGQSAKQNTVLGNWSTYNLSNGSYSLRLEAVDRIGNKANYILPVIIDNGFKISTPYVWPEVFSPNNDGNYDSATIYTVVTEPKANWSVSIKDLNKVEVRQFTGSTSNSEINITWDGKDSNANIVADGSYTYEITATFNNETAGPLTGSIIVDNTLPTVVIASPQNEAVVSGNLNIIGTANDSNIDYWELDYGEGLNPQEWNYLYSDWQPIENATLALWDTAKLKKGDYSIKLYAEDRAGNYSETIIFVHLDKIQITGVSVSSPSFTPANFETVSIFYTLDRNADLTVKIYNLANNLIRTLVNSLPRQQGQNSEVWDGKDDGGNIVKEDGYTISIQAKSENLEGWYQSLGGYEQNWRSVLDFNVPVSFNPYANELCPVSFTLKENSLFTLGVGQNENFDGYQWFFEEKLLASGAHTFYWDGRDSNGKILDYAIQNYPLVIPYDSLSLPENTIIVSGAKTGEITINVDPYAITPYFGEFCNIIYTIPFDGNVSVSIYQANTLVKKIVDNQSLSAGSYSVSWDGRDSFAKLVSSPADYIIKVELANGSATLLRNGNITIDSLRRIKINPEL